MRSAWVALGIVSLLSFPVAAAGIQHPMGMVVLRMSGSDTAILSWTPAAAATDYYLYKGAPDHLELLAKTMTTFFVDPSSPPGTFYVVIATSVLGTEHADSGSGECIEMNDAGSFSVNPNACTSTGN
jgi:hypothetical protein